MVLFLSLKKIIKIRKVIVDGCKDEATFVDNVQRKILKETLERAVYLNKLHINQ